MRILIVEDEALVAMSLQFLLELDGHVITGIVGDLPSTLAAIEQDMPELALVDIQLARGCSGIDVAAAMRDRNVACFFLTGNLPAEPRPDLALGCLQKPYREQALQRALEIAMDRSSGQKPAGEIPEELILY